MYVCVPQLYVHLHSSEPLAASLGHVTQIPPSTFTCQVSHASGLPPLSSGQRARPQGPRLSQMVKRRLVPWCGVHSELRVKLPIQTFPPTLGEGNEAWPEQAPRGERGRGFSGTGRGSFGCAQEVYRVHLGSLKPGMSSCRK